MEIGAGFYSFECLEAGSLEIVSVDGRIIGSAGIAADERNDLRLVHPGE